MMMSMGLGLPCAAPKPKPPVKRRAKKRPLEDIQPVEHKYNTRRGGPVENILGESAGDNQARHRYHFDIQTEAAAGKSC